MIKYIPLIFLLLFCGCGAEEPLEYNSDDWVLAEPQPQDTDWGVYLMTEGDTELKEILTIYEESGDMYLFGKTKINYHWSCKGLERYIKKEDK